MRFLEVFFHHSFFLKIHQIELPHVGSVINSRSFTNIFKSTESSCCIVFVFKKTLFFPWNSLIKISLTTAVAKGLIWFGMILWKKLCTVKTNLSSLWPIFFFTQRAAIFLVGGVPDPWSFWYESGSGSGSWYFFSGLQDSYYFLKVHRHNSSQIKSHKEVTKQYLEIEGFHSIFSDEERIRIRICTSD
jgi:hypothetical protein